MPRKAKAQQPAAPTGQDYGDHQAQIQAQQAMPLPDVKASAPTPGGGSPAPATPPGADPIAAALGMAPPEPPPWNAGPMDEDVTAGLPSGPGPGPEALQMQPRRVDLAAMLQRTAEITGNPYYAELALQAAEGAQA